MKKTSSILIQFLLTIHLCGFSQQAQWAKFFGGRAGSKGREIQADANGNVYSVGDYGFSFNTGAVDFDPGPGVFAFTQPTNTGASYISKLDANGNFIWARTFTNNGVSGATLNKLCLDAEGNVLIAGTFVGTVDFNLGAGVFNVTSYAPTTNSDSLIADFFIAKYSSAGNFIWVKTFSCEPLDIFPSYTISNSFSGLNLDGQNNIILTGSFRGRVDLNPGAGEEWKESGGLNYSSLIIKLNNQGDYIWGKQLAGGDNGSSSMVIDTQNNIYINGIYSQNVDFDPGPTDNWIGIYSFSDSYILKLNSSGDFKWINRIHGPIAGYGGSVDLAMDREGNILATGIIARDSLYLRNATENILLLKSNSFTETGYNAFVTKIDSNGHYLWIKQMASDTEYGVTGNRIACDSINNVYVSGQLSDSADFDYSGNGALLYATGDYSTFLMKLDKNGNYIRTSIIDGDLYVNCSDFSLDKQANIYFTGFFHVVNLDPGFPWGVMIGTGQIDFDPGQDTLALIGLGNGPETVFVAKWSQCSAGTTTLNQTACISFSWNNETYTQSGTYAKSLTTALGCDSIARLNLTVLNSSQAAQNIQICSGETFSIGNQTFTQSGIYQTTLTAANGCDSLVTTNLTVDTLDAEIVLNDNVFTSLNIPQNAQLQWLNCDNSFAIINGETNPTFTATSGGNYAVETSLGNCRDTSNCVLFSSVGLKSNVSNQLKVYPIPADETLFIESEKSNLPIRIFDAQGRLVFQTTSTSKRLDIDVNKWKSGLYFIHMENTSKPFTIMRNR
jgi:hypothetical protein